MICEKGFQFNYPPLASDSLATPLLPNSLATPLPLVKLQVILDIALLTGHGSPATS